MTRTTGRSVSEGDQGDERSARGTREISGRQGAGLSLEEHAKNKLFDTADEKESSLPLPDWPLMGGMGAGHGPWSAWSLRPISSDRFCTLHLLSSSLLSLLIPTLQQRTSTHSPALRYPILLPFLSSSLSVTPKRQNHGRPSSQPCPQHWWYSCHRQYSSCWPR